MTDQERGRTTRRRFLGATAAVGGSSLLAGRLVGASDDATDAEVALERSRRPVESEVDDDPVNDGPTSDATLVTDWRQPTPTHGSLARPVAATIDTDAYAGDVAFDAPVDAGVRAYALDDGAALWERALPGLVGAEPTVVDGVVYVASDQRVFALDAGTGRERWSARGGGSLGVAVGDEYAFVPTGSAKERGRGEATPAAVETQLRAFDRRDGSIAWMWPFDGASGSDAPEFATQPVLHDGTLVVGGEMGLVGLDPESGEVQWRAFDDVDSMTIGAHDVAYCVLGDGEGVAAFDLSHQHRRWMADVQGSDPVYHEGNVFVTHQESEGSVAMKEEAVTAFDAGDGRVQWSRNTWTESSVPADVALVPTTPPTIANDQVVFGAARTSGPRPEHAAIFGLDPKTGAVETHWWAPVPEAMGTDEPSLSRWICGRPTPVGDRLLVSSYDSTGYAPRTQGVYALAWSDSPPGEGPATPNPVQTGGCRIEDDQTSVGVQPYPDRDASYGQGYAYAWDVMDDGVLDDTGARNGMIPVPADASGSVTARVTVRDRFGRTATETLDVDVAATCASFSLSVTPETVRPDEAFTAELDVRNADASAFDYHWAVGDQYEPDHDTTWTTMLPAEGTDALSVRVTSDAGFDETMTTDVTVACEDDA